MRKIKQTFKDLLQYNPDRQLQELSTVKYSAKINEENKKILNNE